MQNSSNREYITIPQAIGLLQVSPSTLYRLMKDGTLDTIKFGSATRISSDSIKTLINGGL
jgi:excisionase family DNA binding protein